MLKSPEFIDMKQWLFIIFKNKNKWKYEDRMWWEHDDSMLLLYSTTTSTTDKKLSLQIV